MPIKKIDVESGNPYRDDEGQFAGPSSSSTTSAGADENEINSEDTEDASFENINWEDSFNNDNFDEDWDEEIESDKDFIKETNSKDFWHTQFPRTMDEVFEDVEKFFDNDDVISVLNNFNHAAFMPSAYGNSASYGQNSVIINAIAKGQYRPMTLLSAQEFDQKVKEKVSKDRWNGNVNWDEQPNSRLGMLQRGVNNVGRVVGSYLKGEGDLFLTNGAYGHCVYSAFNNYTAGGYGRKTLSMLVDNKQGKILDYDKYNSMKRESGLYSKLQDQNFRDEIKQRIVNTLVNKGVNQNDADRDARHFLKALENDEMFPAVCMGYDCVYNTNCNWCFILNFGNIYLRDDKPEFKI